MQNEVHPASRHLSKKQAFSTYASIGSLLLLIIIFVYQFFFYSPQLKINSRDFELHKEYANTLLNKGLYSQAIDAYRELTTLYKINKKQSANLYYQIGTIFQENLHDYENALSSYYRVQINYPDFSAMAEVNKRIVACLERCNKSLDARQELARFTSSADANYKPADHSTIVAEFNDRKINYGEFMDYLKRLPESVQKNITTPQARQEILTEYIVTEILFESAQRAQLQNDPEVRKALDEAEKMILVQQLLQLQIGKQLQDVKPEDVKLYYDANRDRYKDPNTGQPAPFETIAQQVAQEYVREKQSVLYQNYVQQLMQQQQVKIYQEKL